MPSVPDTTNVLEDQSLPAQFVRDIKISDVALTRDDLIELVDLVIRKTEEAREIQKKFENIDLFESEEFLDGLLRKHYRIDYKITDKKDNSVVERAVLDSDKVKFPDDMVSFYLSNSGTFKLASNGVAPASCVDIFLDFSRPSMALNFLNLPSNPTNNGSVINVYGLDENWVISTRQALIEFFDKRKAHRSVIHKSGVYDAFLFLIFIPIMIWMAYKIETKINISLGDESAILIGAIYIYIILFVINIGRMIFLYARWLFPPVEFDNGKKFAAQIHRIFLTTILGGLFLPLLYDMFRKLTAFLGS